MGKMVGGGLNWEWGVLQENCLKVNRGEGGKGEG